MWFKNCQQTLASHVYNVCSLRARNLPVLFPASQHLERCQHTGDSQCLFVDCISFVLCHTHGSENLRAEAQVPTIIRKTDDDCHCFLKPAIWPPGDMLYCDGMWQRWSLEWARSVARVYGGHWLCLRRSPKWHLGWVSGCEWVVPYSYGREVSEILIPLAQTSQKPEQPVRYGRQELEIRNLVVRMNFSDCF